MHVSSGGCAGSHSAAVSVVFPVFTLTVFGLTVAVFGFEAALALALFTSGVILSSSWVAEYEEEVDGGEEDVGAGRTLRVVLVFA